MNVQLRATDPMLVHELVDTPAEYAERVINPTTVVARALRLDPIAEMFAHGHLGPVRRRKVGDVHITVPDESKGSMAGVLLEAARRWQGDAEAAGPRTKSSGHLQEPVDGGGRLPQGITDRQIDAHKRLIHYATLLGPRQHMLLVLVLEQRHSIWGATTKMFPDDVSAPRRRFCGTWFREVLAILAKDMGLASG